MNDDKPVELKAPQDKGPELGPEMALEEIDFSSLIDYFGMDRPSMEEKNDLRELHGLLNNGEQLSKGDLLMKVRNLELQLGSPPTGENRLRRIIGYLDIDRQLTELLKQQRTYIK